MQKKYQIINTIFYRKVNKMILNNKSKKHNKIIKVNL